MTEIDQTAPDAIDVHVGRRIRHLRWTRNMTQHQLAAAIGVRFQQVQKYETGANRVSASRLFRMAQALGCSIGWFFDGAGPIDRQNRGQDAEAVRLATRISALPPHQRAAMRRLLDALMPEKEAA